MANEMASLKTLTTLVPSAQDTSKKKSTRKGGFTAKMAGSYYEHRNTTSIYMGH